MDSLCNNSFLFDSFVRNIKDITKENNTLKAILRLNEVSIYEFDKFLSTSYYNRLFEGLIELISYYKEVNYTDGEKKLIYEYFRVNIKNDTLIELRKQNDRILNIECTKMEN